MKVFFAILFFSSITYCSNAQAEGTNYSMPNTIIKKLTSKINCIEYKLYISYPESFGKGVAKTYPVLYTLDADYSFAIAKNIVDHLTQRNHLDEIIVVGIAYDGPLQYRLNRTRDYTPTNSEEQVSFAEIQKRHSGGGYLFKRFIQEELQPYIEREFAGKGFSALSGHSYGGLFASWLLTQHPEVFDGYIIVSPSLWYDDRLIFRSEWNLSASTNRKLKAYCAVGSREINGQWNMPKDLKDFVKQLELRAGNTIDFKYELHQNETHNSVFPAALSNGIRYVFNGF